LRSTVGKPPFSGRFYITLNEKIYLPRQARDKHIGKVAEKRWCAAFSAGLDESAIEALEGCEKRHFLSHLYIKCIFLPRQARDKHRENSKKSGVLCRLIVAQIKQLQEEAAVRREGAAAADGLSEGGGGDGDGGSAKRARCDG
jgi:hypothetical protein